MRSDPIRPAEQAQREYDEVVRQYTDADGSKRRGWMKAPNGKDTNLTERQWVQVHTPSFKRWFGDWEKDPKNASKVVDENGEPLVVYHGTRQGGHTVFDGEKNGSHSYSVKGAIFFSSSKETADSYTNDLKWTDLPQTAYAEADAYLKNHKLEIIKNENDKIAPYSAMLDGERLPAYSDQETYEGAQSKARNIIAALLNRSTNAEVYSVFLDIKKPRKSNKRGDYWSSGTSSVPDIVKKAMHKEYDGVIVKNVKDGHNELGSVVATTYAVFHSNQIKSATENSGAYSAAENDIRFSIRRNPNLGEDIAAALNVDRTKGEVVKGGKHIVFCRSPYVFDVVGIPQGDIYSTAYTLRKVVKKHSLTAEQIALAPELMERPVAIFEDNGAGYIVLTDALAPDEDGANAPIMFYVRPDGRGNYIASAYARKAAAEAKYVQLAKAGKVMYLDKNKAANLPLRGEAQSSLSTLSVGGNVKTPEDLSSLSSPTSIPYSGAGVQGENAADVARRLTTPFKPGEHSARFSLGGNTDEIAALVIAREILETGRAPSSANVWAVKESLRASGSVVQLLERGIAKAQEQRNMLNYIASDPKRDKILAQAGLADRHARILERARQADLAFARGVEKKVTKQNEALARVVRDTKGLTSETILNHYGIDPNALLIALAPKEKERKRGEKADEQEVDESASAGIVDVDAPHAVTPEMLATAEAIAKLPWGLTPWKKNVDKSLSAA